MGNFSRDTFDQLKHYVGVRLQQGVPIVDADWNELEDIRKFELQAYLRWFVGNGTPTGNDGFHILPSGQPNDFTIQADGHSPGGPGRLLVDGMDVINEAPLAFSGQPLYNNPVLAASWGVLPIQPLSTPVTNRTDTVYIDVWEREVNGSEDSDLINPNIGVETCVRLKREWAVRVEENSTTPPGTIPTGHSFYALAHLNRIGGNAAIEGSTISDLRQTGLTLSDLQDAITHHAARTDNPHQLTPAQIGAIAASDYDFGNRATAAVLFTQSHTNNAPTTINVGFRPRFVWATTSIRANMVSGYFGASSYGFADLQTGIIQRGTRERIYRLSAAPFWRRDSSSTTNHLCRAFFSDVASSPDRVGDFGARIAAVSNTGLTIRFFRDDPTTSTGTGTGGGGGGTGTGASSTQAFSAFQVRIQLVCFG